MGHIIGNGIWRIDWARDRRRHVTQKGQGRDPNIFGAHYLEFGWKYTVFRKKHPLTFSSMSP